MFARFLAALIVLAAPVASADVGTPDDDEARTQVESDILHEKADILRDKARIALASPGGADTVDARREEHDDLMDYADRLDQAGDELDEARAALREARAALIEAEDAAFDVVEDVRDAATARGRESVLGDVMEYVTFASGARERPLNIAFCVTAGGPDPTGYRDLIVEEVRAAAIRMPILENSAVAKRGADSLKLTGVLAPENAIEYIEISDMVRAELIDAAMRTESPALTRASVIPGDFAADACAD
ncbi:MAG: hypothetical protein AAFS03_05910 [Pseudomonadota bacterium]